jgi:hypothetical protein
MKCVMKQPIYILLCLLILSFLLGGTRPSTAITQTSGDVETIAQIVVEGHVSRQVIDDIVGWLGYEGLNSQVPVQNGLKLTVRRWLGLSLGSQVYSRLELSIGGPVDLRSVTFLIDGQAMKTIQPPPYKYFFHTSEYAPGWHELSATGQAADGQILLSNTARYQFLSVTEANRILYSIIGGVVILMAGVLLYQSGILSRKSRKYLPLGSSRNYGSAGGTICPRCGRPFSFHALAIWLFAATLDTCPHCGSVGFFHKLPIEELRQAEAREAEAANSAKVVPAEDVQTKLRQLIDKSRYDERQ